MNWIMIVGVAVFVVILVALVVPSRKDKARADDRKATTELSDWLRGAWARADEAIGAHHKARGAEVGPERERMLRVADEIDTEMGEIERTASVSERQMLMLKLATEESASSSMTRSPSIRKVSSADGTDNDKGDGR